MRELRGEELEEALELVGVAAHRRRELGGIGLGRLDRPHLELEPSVEALDAAEHADASPSSKRRSSSSTSSQMRPSIRPLASTSSSARYGLPFRVVSRRFRATAKTPSTVRSSTRSAIVPARGLSLGAAVGSIGGRVRPFRAVRYAGRARR